MALDVRFDVAISSAAQDAWIAKDLSNLIRRSGFSVYCYLDQPELIKGFFEPRLQDIYVESSLNILLWSSAYAERAVDSIVAMERRFIASRHVYKGDAESLIIVHVDETPLHRDLEGVLSHPLKERGITAIEGFVIERLKKLWTRNTSAGQLRHPPGTEQMRGVLTPCKFTIHRDFETDPLKRWKRLADVRVNFEMPMRSGIIPYLIPSGLATPFLRHSTLLRADPALLEQKRAATLAFLQHRMKRSLDGFSFMQKKQDLELPTIYCPVYDEFLNKSFERQSKK